MPNTETNVKNWYALIAKPRQDKKLASYLEGCDIEHYLPLCKTKRNWSDRIKTVDWPLMSPYLFIKVEDSLRKTVFQSGAALSYVSRLGKASIIAEHEVMAIKNLCIYGLNPEIDSGKIHSGDLVEIQMGAFRGCRGKVQKLLNGYRLILQLDGLGICAQCTIVDKRILKRLN